jgi:hypothetical protein
MKIEKFNEFVNTENELIIYKLIEEGENTPSSDLEYISNRDPYREIVNMGSKVIPYLLERNSIIWDIALKEITGDGLSSHDHKTSERKEYWKKWGKENGY